MRSSQLLISTTKQVPQHAEALSHQLMLRAGLIHQLASGLYSWLPLGLRTLRKIERVVREEINKTGAQEILMPMVQPAELWQKSERWNAYGAELLRLSDRHAREFCLGPTHEEVVTDLVSQEVKSYRQLPLTFYQIQTKFRDEIRPRFGVMRAREFIMKDAYSFHVNQACLEQTYQQMRQAYQRIFQRMELDFKVVQADGGTIGGSVSEEFHVLADTGEDTIAYNKAGNYAANVETVAIKCATPLPKAAQQSMQKVATPGVKSVQEVARLLNVSRKKLVKTLVVHAEGSTDTAPRLLALLIRGDHQINKIKAANHPQIKAPLTMASEQEMLSVLGMKPGFIGPVNLNLPVIADCSAAACSDFICGANQEDYHLTGVNWGRDLPQPNYADLRNAIKGDPSPDGQGQLSICRGIEVGHIFQLGTKYTRAMEAQISDAEGAMQNLIMGCYGIGISRIAAAAVEQRHDSQGIIWPAAIAPFRVVIILLDAPQPEHQKEVKAKAEALYHSLKQLDQLREDVLLDDRDLRPGNKFADMDLLGIPYQIIVSKRSLENDQFECKTRSDQKRCMLKAREITEWLGIST